MSNMHSDFQSNNFPMAERLCPFCCQKHLMADYSGVWFCTKRPLSQGGLSEKNLNLLSGNIKVLHERMDKEWEEKNKAIQELKAFEESYKELGERYIELKEKLQREKNARVASNRRAEQLADNREREEQFMNGFARMMRKISNNIAFLTVKD